MIKINQDTAIVYSAHLGTKKENIGDVLSAKAIAIMSGLTKARLYCLPGEIGLSANRPVIYGGGGMIRPLFYKKEDRDFKLRNKNQPHAIYGIGINLDVGGYDFTRDDLNSLEQWLTTAKSVTVRDLASYDFLQKKFNFKAKIAPCPTYSVLKNKKREFLGTKYHLGIVPSLGHTKTYDGYRNEIIAVIQDLIKKVGPEKISFICHDEQDYDAIKMLFGDLGVSIVRPVDFDHVHESYSDCGAIFTLRGHGIIFAAAAGRPCSFVPLNVKLNALYSYHYGGAYRDINFNAGHHLDNLDKRQPPLNINTDFSL